MSPHKDKVEGTLKVGCKGNEVVDLLEKCFDRTGKGLR